MTSASRKLPTEGMQLKQEVKLEATAAVSEFDSKSPTKMADTLTFPVSFTQAAFYSHWRSIGISNQLHSDQEIACFLMKCYDGLMMGASLDSQLCKTCQSPLQMLCFICQGVKTNKPENQEVTSTSPSLQHKPKNDQVIDQNLQVSCRQHMCHSPVGDQQHCSSDSYAELCPNNLSNTEEEILDEDDDTDQQQSDSPPPSAKRKMRRAALPKEEFENGELPEEGDDEDWHPARPQFPAARAKRGRPCRQSKYGNISLVCSECNKTMSSRQAVISHLYTQHAICVPGTEKFHAAKKLAHKCRKTEDHSRDSEFLAARFAHKRRKALDHDVLSENSCTESDVEKLTRTSGQNSESENDYSQGNSELPEDMNTAEDMEEADDSDLKTKKRKKERGRGMRRKKKGSEEGRLCEVCGASFTDRKQLYSHRQNCQSTTCQLCGRQVKRIKTHMMRHMQNKRFKCPKCPKSFPFRTNLQQHLIYHSDERPHVCEVCGTRYREKSRLNDHLRTHSGLKPFKCSQCDAAFTRSRGLKDHLRVHTGEKPYSCQACGRLFSSTGNLAAHRRKVHKMEPLPYNHDSEKNTLRRRMQARLGSDEHSHEDAVLSSALQEMEASFSAVQTRLVEENQIWQISPPLQL